MKLTVRSRIVVIYAILAGAFLVVLFTSLSRLNKIGIRLHVIQDSYLPIVKTINAAANFYHLDDAFDVSKIVANRTHRLFIDAITIANPQLLESGLSKGLRDAQNALTKGPERERQSLNRISELVTELTQQHQKYSILVREIWVDIEKGHLEMAQSKNQALLDQKRLVRSRIDFLARQLDDRIRSSIQSVAIEERNAVYLTLGLSIATLILSLLVGLWVLISLRPLNLLKKAAQEIAAGDLAQRVQIQSEDEVGDLAKEFNRMADSIEQRDEALRKQQEQLVRSERMAVLGRMASKINHEVRNPLNALSLNVEMLQDEVQGEKAQNILRSISLEIDRLSRTAESYLSLARPSTRFIEDLSIETVFAHLETLIRPECTQRGFALKMEMESALPPIKIDKGRLEQALINLIRNAMEASRPGGELGVRALFKEGQIQIDVWDQGSGIPTSQLQSIFEPFYTTKEKGTGLGLAITNEIIREQGGAIDCISQSGVGTTFRITIPVADSTVHNDV